MKKAHLIMVLMAFLASSLVILHSYLLDGLNGLLLSFAFGEDTVYAQGFRDSNFRRLRPGMTEEDALRILPTPLGETWIYGSSPARDPSQFVGFTGDTVDHVHGFNQDRSTLSRLSAGMTKDEVAEILGAPLEKSLVFTKSLHDKSYRVRVVSLSRGVVSKKTAYFYVD